MQTQKEIAKRKAKRKAKAQDKLHTNPSNKSKTQKSRKIDATHEAEMENLELVNTAKVIEHADSSNAEQEKEKKKQHYELSEFTAKRYNIDSKHNTFCNSKKDAEERTTLQRKVDLLQSSSCILDINFADSVDSYGKGSPTDRLQFGYAPSNTDEAVAFHSITSPSNWVAQRRANGRIICKQKHKLNSLNCEPVTSVLKLKVHWSKLAEFNSQVQLNDTTSRDPDSILNMLASRQRIM